MPAALVFFLSHFFFFFFSRRAAEVACQSVGAHLVTINGFDELNLASALYQSARLGQQDPNSDASRLAAFSTNV